MGPSRGVRIAKDSSIFVETIEPMLHENERVLADNTYYDERERCVICASLEGSITSSYLVLAARRRCEHAVRAADSIES